MLTQLLIRDETTASLGKTEHTFMVYVSGKTIGLDSRCISEFFPRVSG